MKLWIDDVRPAPQGYRWIKTSLDAINAIRNYLIMYEASGHKDYYKIEIIDLDHDAGEFVKMGGDYIFILEWMEHFGIDNIPIHIHSMNPDNANAVNVLYNKLKQL